MANAVLAKGKEFIKQKTGVDLDKAILSQEDMVALKKYEAEHEEELLKLRLEENKLDLDEMKAFLADTEGARKREVTIATSPDAPFISKVAPPIIAFGTIILTFALFFIVMTYDFDPVNTSRKEIILYILGVLSAISTQIFSYYFGSSQGSAYKSQTIENVLGGKK